MRSHFPQPAGSNLQQTISFDIFFSYRLFKIPATLTFGRTLFNRTRKQLLVISSIILQTFTFCDLESIIVYYFCKRLKDQFH